jgi:hypothetical protein
MLHLVPATSKVFKASSASSYVFAQEREIFYKKKTVHLLQDTSLPHLVSLFPVPPIPTLLVGRSVTTQTPSSNNNSNTNNERTQAAKETKKFKAKKNLSLSTLSNREEFFYN